MPWCRPNASLGLVVLVAGGLTVSCLLAIKPAVIGLYHDDALYAVVAKSLSEGTGYRIVSLPSSPAQLKYPFLYSYVLSWLWGLMPSFPDNVVLLKALNAAALFVGLFFSYGLFHQHVEARRIEALAYMFLIGANSWVFPMTTLTLSETFFLTLMVLAFALGEASRPAHVVALAIVVAGACLTRTPGMALVLAFVVSFLLRRRYRHLVVFSGVTAAMCSPWWLWQFVNRNDPDESVLLHYYVAYQPDSHAFLTLWSDWRRAVEIVSANLWYVAESVDVGLLLGVVPGLRLCTYALLAAGIYQSLRARLEVHHVFATVYLLLIVGWPWHPGRFMVPLIPVLLLFLFRGVQAAEVWAGRAGQNRFWRTLRWLPRVPVVVIVLVTGIWLVLYVYDDPKLDVRPPHERHHHHWQGFLETFAWIREHTAASDVLATGYDPMYYLYTGRQAVRPWLYKPSTYFYPRDRPVVDLGAVDEIQVELTRLGVRYLIVDPLDGFKEAEAAPRLFENLLESYPVKPTLVFTSSDALHRIYRLP